MRPTRPKWSAGTIVLPFTLATAAITGVINEAAAQVVSFQGVGPVRLGMSVEAAEHALQARLKSMSLAYTEQCWITARADEVDPGIQYTIQDGKITRIDLSPTEGGPMPPATTLGVGIGSTEADIRRAYKNITTMRAPYYDEESEIAAAKTRAELGVKSSEGPAHYWVQVDSPDHQRAIIFETSEGKVLSFQTGFQPIVAAMEGCS